MLSATIIGIKKTGTNKGVRGRLLTARNLVQQVAGGFIIRFKQEL